MDKKAKKQLILALAAATGGLSSLTIASNITIYDKIFSRYERPDYSITPGLICYDRLKHPIKREEINFYSDDILLKGHYYSCNNAKGIVVIAHGIHSGGDDYLNIINYLIKNNYNVFSFNYKGTYDSYGDSTVGMCESLVDLDHAIDYIQKTSKYNKLPLFLLGHSWGGYAVTAVLALKNNIAACACISAMNDGFKIVLEKGSQYVGKLSNTSKPFLDVYQRYLFKDYVNYNGVLGINNVSIPVLIAHGVDDNVIVFDKQSIISHKNEIKNPNVTYYIGKGLQGDHTNIMFSNKANLYRLEVESELKLLKMNKQDKLTLEEKQKFYKTINHELYSEVNEELMELIIKTFDSAL